MRRITIALIITGAMLCACNESTDKKSKTVSKEITNIEMKKIEEPEFDIITTHGDMRVKLYAKAPQHRDNFVKLVSENFYDGIRFHRVIEGFMIQTGDPYSRDTALIHKWGTGGPTPYYTVQAEFVEEYRHKKGALAAARRGDKANPSKASSGSQFYIVHDSTTCAQLDGHYTVFGEVTRGLEVIDRIASVATDRYDRPYEDVIILGIKPVIEVAPKVEATEQVDSTKTE